MKYITIGSTPHNQCGYIVIVRTSIRAGILDLDIGDPTDANELDNGLNDVLHLHDEVTLSGKHKELLSKAHVGTVQHCTVQIPI